MKLLIICSLGLPALGFAENMPRGAFKSTQFAEAREAAKTQGKALIYIETDSKSTCPKTEWGTAEAYSALKRKYILVIEDDADPESIDVKELNSAITQTVKIGNMSPRITVVEPENLGFITGTDYTNMSSDKRWAKNFHQTIAAAAIVPKILDADAVIAREPTLRNWTNMEGKTIRAALIEKKDAMLSLKLENGKLVDYPVEKLSAASKATLVELTAK
ncbi:MAG: hypothetical protein H7Y36_05005 [Armatimonadetes bacterium]|nr:hypothetical protein [Akkermansiaceae bacterium]